MNSPNHREASQREANRRGANRRENDTSRPSLRGGEVRSAGGPAKRLRSVALTLPLLACQPIQIGLSGDSLAKAGGSSIPSEAGASARANHSRGGTSNGGAASSDVAGTLSEFGGASGKVGVGAYGFGGWGDIGGTPREQGGTGGSIGAAGSSSEGGGMTIGAGGGSTARGGTAGSIDGGTTAGIGGVALVGGGGIGATDGGIAGAIQGGGVSVAGASSDPKFCPGSSIAIRGRVVSPRGQPLEGVKMTLSGSSVGTTWTDVRGEYRFAQLCSGRSELVPERADLSFCSPRAVFHDLTTSVDEDFTGSNEGCEPAEIVRRVEVIVFDPRVPDATGGSESLIRREAWNDPMELAEQYRRAIETATNGRVRYELAGVRSVNEFPMKMDGFRYTPDGYLECLEHPTEKCHEPDLADYTLIDSTQSICEDANNGVLDEVWLFGGPYFGFSSLRWFAPHKDLDLGSKVGSNCFRRINVFGFSYERALGEMLHATQTQLQTLVGRVYAHWYPAQTDSVWHRFTAAYALPGGAAEAGCGDDARAPNATVPWEYDDQRVVASTCDSFYDYPNLSAPPLAQSLTCEAWGCNELGYRRFWFRHLPFAKGTGPDGVIANWWRYLLAPDDFVAAMETGDITCSDSLVYGWCQLVNDDRHGTCNEGEWATPNRSTGWVEWAWPSSRKVGSVALYDRGCGERVLEGHLEFSDGSPSIGFGPLEDTGTIPTKVTFPMKQLRWLRIYIDVTAGGKNPGLGEIDIE